MKPCAPRLQTCLLMVALLFMGVVYYQVAGLSDGVQRVIQQHERPMQTASTTVTNTTGTAIEIITVRLEGETTETWLQRHNEAVAAAMAT